MDERGMDGGIPRWESSTLAVAVIISKDCDKFRARRCRADGYGSSVQVLLQQNAKRSRGAYRLFLLSTNGAS